jgi:dienelactone hydrolase
MKQIVFLLLMVTFSSYAQKKTTRLIDKSAIPMEHLIWDVEKLSLAPEVEWKDKSNKVHSLLYKSVDYDGHPTQVFAYYSNPDLLMGNTNSKRKFPGVVLIHGGGGTAFKVWVEKWAAEGYAAIAMDLSGNGPDGRKLAMAGPDQSHEIKFDKIATSHVKDVWTYHAVASAILSHSLLLSFPEVDANRTGVNGISWGGYLTCIVGSVDSRFKAAVPVYGCGYYDESDVFKVSLAQLSAENRAKWLRYFDPSVYLPFAQSKFLFLNGNRDRFYNVEPYKKTYDLVSTEQRKVLLLPDMKHSHEWGWEPHEIRYFFESILKQTAPLSGIRNVVQNEREISATYETPVSIWYADFYYSNDVTSSNENRQWIKQSVKIDREKNTLSTSTPENGFKYGFFHMKDHRNLSASSEFIVN